MMAWTVNGVIRPWDLATGQETPALGLYRQGVQWAGFSANGQWLRAAGPSGELGVWDPATGRPHRLQRAAGLTAGIYYTPAADRAKLVLVSGVNNIGTKSKESKQDAGRIFLWDLSGNAGPVPLREQAGPAWYAALTPDNRFVVATETSGRIRVYDAATGKPTRSFDGREYEYGPTFSPDGTLLATTAGNWKIWLYDFASGPVLRELKGLSPARCLAFSPDGRWLATGHSSMDKRQDQPGDMIYLWDTATGRELRRIPSGHREVAGLCFSSDGQMIASCGFDQVVRIWEAVSGQERRRYDGHGSEVLGVDFAPDGRRLASASLDGTALVWRVFDPAPAERSAADLESLWTDLAKDGKSAHAAIAGLIAAKETVAFLKGRLKPAALPSDQQLHRWLADLGSPAFKTRVTAQKEITRVSEQVEPSLRVALQKATDAEVRRRLAALLESIPRPETRPEQLRELRAVELLGHLDQVEARRLLADLAKGAPGASVTRLAKASLARLVAR
jgi:WD40 repeat protein